MKKKFYGLMALTLLGVALSSCGKSKNVSEKDTTTVADTTTDTSNSSTSGDDLSTTTKTKTTINKLQRW